MRKVMVLVVALATSLVFAQRSSADVGGFVSYIPPSSTVTLERPMPAVVPIAPVAPPLDLVAVATFLRALPPDTLIRIAFADLGPATVEKALYVACREGGMGKDRVHPKRNPCAPQNRVPAVSYDPSCGADNLHSSASGLFQYLDDWAGWGGYSWADIVSRDCYTDVMMTRAYVGTKGWGPWKLTA